MLRQRYGLGIGIVAMASALACQPVTPGIAPVGGELTMQVRWPMRIQAIPPETAVVAVGVFRNGQLIGKGSFNVGIVGRGAGTILYGGLQNGDYRVVAGAYDKDARPLAGGAGNGTINIAAAPRTQVQLSLKPGDPAAELTPFLPDIQRYLAGLPKPQASPSGPPTPAPTGNPTAPAANPTPGGTPNTPPPSPASSAPAPATTSSPPASGGGGGGAGNSASSTVSFTGGFQ